MPEDNGYEQAALDGIKALNERYCAGQPERFFVCHRRRVWNPDQNCWMGWERKRGKLVEFNRLLRGDRNTSFAVDAGLSLRVHSSGLDRLPQIRFVITLDADTQLPHETARRMIATLAHPLNQPCFDPEQGRVVSGYGVLQPRARFSHLAQFKGNNVKGLVQKNYDPNGLLSLALSSKGGEGILTTAL